MAKGFQSCENGHVVPGPKSLVCKECGGKTTRALNLEKAASKPLPIVTPEGEPVLIAGDTRKVYVWPDGYTFPSGNVERIHTPAGSPPIRLKPRDGQDFPDDDDIVKWAGDVRQYMLDKHNQYIVNAGLARWARDEVNPNFRYPPGGDEMEYLNMIVNSLPDVTLREVPA